MRKQLFDIERFRELDKDQQNKIVETLQQMSIDYLSRMSPIDVTELYKIASGSGGFYVMNCSPNNIPPECQRTDCLMRTMVSQMSPEEYPDIIGLNCTPPGYLADFINYAKAIQLVGKNE